MQKEIEKKILVSKIIASEMAAVNCLYYEGNTCHGNSVRQQTVLRICISARRIFSNPIAFIDINKYAKLTVVMISKVLLPAHHARCQSAL